MKQRQKGMTFIGVLIIGAMVAVLGYGAVRLFPIYLTQFKIRQLMSTLVKEHEGNAATPRTISLSIARHLDIDFIDFPRASDFVIRKSDGGLTVEVAYEDRTSFLGPVFLGAEFENSVEIPR
jgi:hypothetical protein